MIEYPFVYIASIMRTGSTLVQELLTDYVDSYILHEPRLAENMFNVKDSLIKDLPVNVKVLLGDSPSVESFATKVAPILRSHYKQIGVKETVNTNWIDYITHFPNIRIILTARNPRDLYYSIYNWCHKGDKVKSIRGLPFSFENISKVISNDLYIQMEMFKTGRSIKIQYEKLCKEPESVILAIKHWIKSPMEAYGKIGGFLENYDKRRNEHLEHNGVITINALGKYKNVDSKLIDDIERFDEEMIEYKNFWGYK